MLPRLLTALPVYDEARHVCGVLDQVLRYSRDVLVVDDGSTDGTSELLARRTDIRLVRHPQNAGYGTALKTAFDYADDHGFEWVVTIDCDGQHEPQLIPDLSAACGDVDIVSGSRYLRQFGDTSEAPAERQRINVQITDELNSLLGLQLTDAFCGFKAYRVDAIQQLQLEEPGYAMPLELWIEAAHARLRICEYPVPLIYLDEERSFGGMLDDGQARLEYYHQVIQATLDRYCPVATADCEPFCAEPAPRCW